MTSMRSGQMLLRACGEGSTRVPFPWGRLMPESEQLVAAFQRRLYDALTA
jgi:hypothetical protein